MREPCWSKYSTPATFCSFSFSVQSTKSGTTWVEVDRKYFDYKYIFFVLPTYFTDKQDYKYNRDSCKFSDLNIYLSSWVMTKDDFTSSHTYLQLLILFWTMIYKYKYKYFIGSNSIIRREWYYIIIKCSLFFLSF